MNINRRMKALEELFGTNDGDAEEIEAYREQLLSEARAMGGPTYRNPRWIEWWREQLTPQRIRKIMALRRQADAEGQDRGRRGGAVAENRASGKEKARRRSLGYVELTVAPNGVYTSVTMTVWFSPVHTWVPTWLADFFALIMMPAYSSLT